MGDYHIPVLLNESVSALALYNGGVYADVTFGGGGHSAAILKEMGKNSRLIAMDQDSAALENGIEEKRVIMVHANYRFLPNYIEYYGFTGVDGILADLGVSSHQFDTKERGFSFRFDAPLDMRMNQLAKRDAVQILNSYTQQQLETLFWLYGEVKNSRRIAAQICSEREKMRIESTSHLNKILAPLTPKLQEHKFLAKIYQALRIEVNGEMNSLKLFLESAASILNPGGRLVVITYHSLEDRMVKNCMKSGNIEGRVIKDHFGNFETPYTVITKKPIIPSQEEIGNNPRARSAKLRVAQKR